MSEKLSPTEIAIRAIKAEGWDEGFQLGVKEGADAILGEHEPGQEFSKNPYREVTHD